MGTTLPVLNSFVRPDVCGPCGGTCCKTLPGAAMPHDFGSTPAAVMAEVSRRLESGKWKVDWWEGDPRDDRDDIERGYFIRPSTVSDCADWFAPSWGGQCSFHTESGCSIFENRPSGCRGLAPKEDKHCESRHSSKRDAAIAWIPYHEAIAALDQFKEGVA